MKKDKVTIIKVAGGSQVSGVSGSLVKVYEANPNAHVEMHAIGASAVSQAVKAMATARGILATKGIDLTFKPGFGTTTIDGQERTVIIFKPVID